MAIRSLENLFIDVLEDKLCSEGIHDHELVSLDKENLIEIVSRNIEGYDFDSGRIVSELMTTKEVDEETPDYKITEFMLFSILDEGDDTEKQMVSEYIDARTKLDQIEATMKDNIVHYGDRAKHFYSSIDNIVDAIKTYTNKNKDNDDENDDD